MNDILDNITLHYIVDDMKVIDFIEQNSFLLPYLKQAYLYILPIFKDYNPILYLEYDKTDDRELIWIKIKINIDDLSKIDELEVKVYETWFVNVIDNIKGKLSYYVINE